MEKVIGYDMSPNEAAIYFKKFREKSVKDNLFSLKHIHPK